MKTNEQATLLRIFLSSTDKSKQELLCESIILKAKNFGLAGATALKGMLGFGASSIIHSYKFWEISDKLPVVIEIIDEQEKIASFYETIRTELETMRYGCLVTTEKVNILLYKPGEKRMFD